MTPPSGRLFALALLPLSLLLLSCGGDDTPEAVATTQDQPTTTSDANDTTATEAPATEDETATTATGSVTTEAGVYDFVPETCFLLDDEATVMGVGPGPDGRMFTVTINVSPANSYASIELLIAEEGMPSPDGTDEFRIYDLEADIGESTLTGSGPLTDLSVDDTATDATVEVDCA